MSEPMQLNLHLQHSGIKGMRWGMRRYQNPDGTLTEAGKERYGRDIQKNNQKKKENRADEESLKDPARWVKEDLTTTKTAVDSTEKLTNTVKDLNNKIPSKGKERLDLSKKSDKELRDEINRELLERQYNDIFNPGKVSKGRETVDKVLDYGGKALAVGSSALGIMLAIHQLKNGG